MIQVAHLRKSYGSLIAVNDVSFEVGKGETFGLLGPNGAGKTTTIHMMAGALKPDSGAISIDGLDDPMLPEVRKRIGVAPQALSLYDQLTGEENVAFFGKLYGLNGADLNERAEWALDFTGLTDRRHDRLHTYSGGMQRRLNLACAIVHDPPVIYLDEPTAGVDPQSRNHLYEKIEELADQGRTILYTTHYMEEAQRLCDRVAIMDQGAILALDSVNGLIHQHGGSPVLLAELERPPGPGIRLPGDLNGTSLRLETDQPFEEAARLNETGIRMRELRVERPDLEAVFLALTGRRLRD